MTGYSFCIFSPIKYDMEGSDALYTPGAAARDKSEWMMMMMMMKYI